ncbi:alpha/beta hydrolase family protein [Tasmannia lanceolata]|uniref:alpha/beta hydrolase family protein n=1 Tax=Tasmannia lanceolata TaxID=3420 RepID=UPI00406282A5
MPQADVRSALQFAATMCYLNPIHLTPRKRERTIRTSWSSWSPARVRPLRAFSSSYEAVEKKPPICTADELHYVPVHGTDWRLALWRYTPSPNTPLRNHPLILLSGVGTNAIGFDLSPGSSFARYMSSQGFDTWIVEFRGAGLSTRAGDSNAIGHSANDFLASELANSMDMDVNTDVFSAEQLSIMINGALPESETVQDAGLITQRVGSNAVGSELTKSIDKDLGNGVSSEQQSVMRTGVLPESEISTVKGNKRETVTVSDDSKLVTNLTETLLRLTERLSGFLNEGQSRVMSARFVDQISKLLEDAQLSERFSEIRGKLSRVLEGKPSSSIASQVRDLSQRIVNIIEEGQRSVSPQLFDLQERLSTTIEDFQKQLDLIVKYDWDFDNYLEEDVPAAMEYVRAQCKPKDGKVLAIGHSMGGILLYSMLSRHGYEGRNPGLAAVVTLASSLDYTSSKSSLKLLLPLADPAQALNVPVVPLGALMAACYPLSCRPPYVLSWLNPIVSAQDMMHPELFAKLVLNNFCTIPTKLLLQLTTAFRDGGLRDRRGSFCYKHHLHKINVPVLALAGDQDLICPPEAVYETVKIIPQHLVTYKIFGQPNGLHYGHYDLVGGHLAVDEVYPCIIEFLSRHDV